MDGANGATVEPSYEQAKREKRRDDRDRPQVKLVDARSALAGGLLVAGAYWVSLFVGFTVPLVLGGSVLAGGWLALANLDRGGTILDAAAAPMFGAVVALVATLALRYFGVLQAPAGDVLGFGAVFFAFVSPGLAILSGTSHWVVTRLQGSANADDAGR